MDKYRVELSGRWYYTRTIEALSEEDAYDKVFDELLNNADKDNYEFSYDDFNKYVEEI